MAGETPKLIVLSEQLRGTTFALVEQEYAIGRSEACSICIPDPTISSKHCALTREPDGCYLLTDNGSTNGTRVNGMKVQAQRLANSDILQFGGVELLYESQEKSSTTALSTQTGINLQAPSGTVSVSDMENFSKWGSRSTFSSSKAKKGKLISNVVIGVIALAVILVLYQLIRIFVLQR